MTKYRIPDKSEKKNVFMQQWGMLISAYWERDRQRSISNKLQERTGKRKLQKQKFSEFHITNNIRMIK
jgi:hypothetical protein